MINLNDDPGIEPRERSDASLQDLEVKPVDINLDAIDSLNAGLGDESSRVVNS